MTDPYTKLIFNDNGTGSRNIGYDEQGNWIYESLTEDIHDDQMIYFIENEQIYTLDLICDRYTEINDIEKNCLDFFLASYARHYFYDKETDTIYEPLASNSSLEKIKADFINGTANPFDEIYKRIK